MSWKSEVRGMLGMLSAGGYVNGIQYHGKETLRVPENPKLLGSSVKVEKGRKKGVRTAILYLAPADSAPLTRHGKPLNLCPWASDGCRAGCLGEHAGRMVMSSVRNARVWKTALYFMHRNLFYQMLEKEIQALAKKSASEGSILAVRLDGTSDLGLADGSYMGSDGRYMSLPERFPDAMFYDYTKSPHRVTRPLPIKNRHFTYSASERPESETVADLALRHGHSVAAIVSRLPENGTEWSALQRTLTGNVLPSTTIDGDETDARFLDNRTIGGQSNRGAIVALSVKGGPRVRKLLGRMVFEV